MAHSGEQSVAIEQQVSQLIYKGCLLLDAADFKGWLDLCAPEFQYTISTGWPTSSGSCRSTTAIRAR